MVDILLHGFQISNFGVISIGLQLQNDFNDHPMVVVNFFTRMPDDVKNLTTSVNELNWK